jgi:hypothetical protein
MHAPVISYTRSMAPAVGAGWGFTDFWGLGTQKGWDAAAWSAKGLLLPGGNVRVAITVEADAVGDKDEDEVEVEV